MFPGSPSPFCQLECLNIITLELSRRHHNQILFHLDPFETKAQWLYSENHLWCSPPPFQWILLPQLASANMLFQSLLTSHAHRWREKHWSTCYSTASSSCSVLSLKWGRSREVWLPRVSQGKLLLSLFRLTAVLKTPGMRSTSTTSPCVGQRNKCSILEPGLGRP